MDSHVAHPAGIVATLAELGGPHTKDAKGAKDIRPEDWSFLDHFICNVGELYEPEPNEFLGEPRETKHFNAAQLKIEGIRGLYRKNESGTQESRKADCSEGCGQPNTSENDEARAKVGRQDRAEGPELGCLPERKALGRREITASRPQPSLRNPEARS